MKKLIAIIVILAVAVVMALTVPDKKTHRETMMKAINEYVDEEAANMGIADNGVTRAGKKVLTKTIEGVLTYKLEVSNYIFFNTTHARIGGQDKLLSVGLFGHVFTFDKEMLRKELEKAVHDKE